MQTTDKFEIVPVAEITPDARNARKHSDEQIKELCRSLREFGFVNPLLIDKDKKVIAGRGRLMAAIAEGMTAVRVCTSSTLRKRREGRTCSRTTVLLNMPRGTSHC
jgi:hypothetical protein